MAFGKQILNSMQYKSFTWEFNPEVCTYSCNRTYVVHKYPELSGVNIEDMDINQVVITGTGEFFGENAYSNWMKLNDVYRSFGPGKFSHPIFTDVTRALMTKLEANLEPRENYVKYSFEIVGEVDVYSISTPATVPLTSSGGNDSNPNSNKINVGDIVILTGYAYYTSYGATPRSEYKNGVKYTVTYTNYNGSHPIHCGSLGWCRLADVKLASTSNDQSGATSDVVYVVKSGDTLSGICAKYGANWKSVAEYNKLKNPNLIYPNQKINIHRSMITK